MAGPNTIILKATRLTDRYDEKVAAGAITPGHLINFDNTGKVVVHATAFGGGPVMVAIEDSFQGKTIDDAYASTDLVRMHLPQNADELYMLLGPTAGTAAIGSVMVSKGDGTLQVSSAGTGGIKFTALEAVAQGTAAQRLRVRAFAQ